MATTNKWFSRLTGASASWAQRDANLVIPPEQSVTVTYKLLSSVEQAVSVTYNVLADIGLISGQVVLPVYSAERDLVSNYQVLVISITKDVVPTYRVLNYVEKTTDQAYRILNTAELDRTLLYSSGGFVEQDVQGFWAMHQGAERDSSVITYDVIEAISSDLACDYVLNTDPWTAALNLDATYRVINSIEKEFGIQYRVFNGAEKDLSIEYDLKSEAYETTTVTFDVNSIAQADRQVIYTLVEKDSVSVDTSITYSVFSSVRKVPNVIGHPLPKAKKLITDADLLVGTITYQ